LTSLSFSSRDITRSGFLQNVSDLLLKIADITSNKDFQSHALNSLDFAHYQSMIEHHAFGSSELLCVLDTIVDLLSEIQSEVRKKEYQEWYHAITASFRQPENEELAMNSLVLFLPLFFEMAMARIDELQIEVRPLPPLFFVLIIHPSISSLLSSRQISNFYLSLLGTYATSTVSETLSRDLTQQIMAVKGSNSNPEDPSTFSLLSLSNRDYSFYLPKTHRFLCSNLFTSAEGGDEGEGNEITRELKDYFLECDLGAVSAADIGQSRSVDTALIARSFCQLLQTPSDLLSPQV
jgi:hypothetical protein